MHVQCVLICLPEFWLKFRYLFLYSSLLNNRKSNSVRSTTTTKFTISDYEMVRLKSWNIQRRKTLYAINHKFRVDSNIGTAYYGGYYSTIMPYYYYSSLEEEKNNFFYFKKPLLLYFDILTNKLLIKWRNQFQYFVLDYCISLCQFQKKNTETKNKKIKIIKKKPKKYCCLSQ